MAYGSIINQTFSFDPNDITINANQIIGTLASSQIPNLDASKITSGTLNSARIPNLDASKITSGVLPVERGGTGTSSLDELSETILNGKLTNSFTITGNYYRTYGSGPSSQISIGSFNLIKIKVVGNISAYGNSSPKSGVLYVNDSGGSSGLELMNYTSYNNATLNANHTFLFLPNNQNITQPDSNRACRIYCSASGASVPTFSFEAHYQGNQYYLSSNSLYFVFNNLNGSNMNITVSFYSL